MADPVTSPAHYTQGSIEFLNYVIAQKMDFLEGNVVKYITRYKDRLIERESNDD